MSFSMQLARVDITFHTEELTKKNSCILPPPERCVAVRRISGRIMREWEEKGREREEKEEEECGVF